MSRKILVISHDKVGPSMAGPGIRYHQIALNLAKEHDVTLAVFNPTYIEGLSEKSYKAIDIHVQKFEKEFIKYDAIVALWLSDEMIRFAKKNGINLIFDLYAPVPVEDLVQRTYGGKTDKVSDYDYEQMLDNYGHFINNGDFFLTSNPQQNDFWLAYAFAYKKINPSKQLARPIDTYFNTAPMGINLDDIKGLDSKPDLLTKRVHSIKKDDFIIVWTGGIWDWFDATTPIEAMKLIKESGNTKIKLIFLGTKHPNSDVPAMKETDIARDLAAESGLLDKQIFFLDGWLPYGERVQYLKRADLALYAHKPSIEARFSHRTRVLDHILMSLPTVATSGDYLSDYMNEHGMGISVEPYNANDLANAVLRFADSPAIQKQYKKTVTASQNLFTWDSTLTPLRDFLNNKNYTSSEYRARPSETTIQKQANHPVLRKVKRHIPQRVKNAIKKVIR